MKKCQFCAEEIQDAAIKCKHCGEMLSAQKSETRKCCQCNMEIPKGGMICPYCKKDPGVMGLVSNVIGGLFVLGIIGLSFVFFPGFWGFILACFASMFK